MAEWSAYYQSPARQAGEKQFVCLSQCPRHRLLALSEWDHVTIVRQNGEERKAGLVFLM